MKRALLSVFDKTNIIFFAEGLIKAGFELISTGGTATVLRDAGFSVRDVSEITAFPECLGGRVKTLHPLIFGGILGKRDEHRDEMSALDLRPIDVVCVNLYPFKETLLRADSSSAEQIEMIDIGGPSMLRAAAKNFQDVTVVTDPADYRVVLEELNEGGATTLATRKRLAAKVFATTASYDALIADFFRRETADEDELFPLLLTPTYERVSTLRYGENPAQRAAFYHDVMPQAGGLDQAVQLQGKELSYNNLADADAAIALLREFSEPTVVAIKHANPAVWRAQMSCLRLGRKRTTRMMSLSLGASLPLIAR